METLKKYKGYIILSVIFIAIIAIIYFTLKSKKEFVYIAMPDTVAVKKIDSLKTANGIIESEMINIKSEKEKIKYVIINNQKNYENEIKNIQRTTADSNYLNILNRLGSE